LEERSRVTVPTLSVSGGDFSFSGNRNELPNVTTMHGLELANVHHWSFGTNLCQYRQALEDSEAPSSVISTAEQLPWHGCGSQLRDITSVQERIAQTTVTFLDNYLRSDMSHFESLFPSPENSRERYSAELTVSVASNDVYESFVLTDPAGRRLGKTNGEEFKEVDGARIQVRDGFFSVNLGPNEILPGSYQLTIGDGTTLSNGANVDVKLLLSEKSSVETLFLSTQLVAEEFSANAAFGPWNLSLISQVPEPAGYQLSWTAVIGLLMAVRSHRPQGSHRRA
jgi:hypothetical protein